MNTNGRHALIVANYAFEDAGLRQLKAPAHDAERLANVLRDPAIGAFDVQTIVNQPAEAVNFAVEEFFAERKPDDLLVVYFSGHGIKDEDGDLYFAAATTRLNRLGATAIGMDFVNRRMNRSRSRRIVLLLDCCYSGAFARGMIPRAGTEIALGQQFGGRGRAVITASSAMEYAFEGSTVANVQDAGSSVFTTALIDALMSGDADRDQDGYVSLDELYDYIYDHVHRATPHQTPGKWTFDLQGELRIAKRGKPVTVPAPLPSSLQEATDNGFAGVRAGAVQELTRLLNGRHAGLALAARQALERLADDDSRAVSTAATEALRSSPAPQPDALTEPTDHSPLQPAPVDNFTPAPPTTHQPPRPVPPTPPRLVQQTQPASAVPPEPSQGAVSTKDYTKLFGWLGIGLAFACPPLGILFGVLSWREARIAKRTPTLAILAIVLGVLATIFWIPTFSQMNVESAAGLAGGGYRAF